MELNEFCRYIENLQTYKKIQKEMKSYPKILDTKYRELIARVKGLFADEDNNIERWLEGKPCVFTHPHGHQQIEYKIGNDYEALYYFLMFCKRINHHKRISEEHIEYLAFLIARSNHPDWEEA